MAQLGDYSEDTTAVRVYFTTHDKAGGIIAPSAVFNPLDVSVYKDGGAIQKVTTNGMTMTSPFDAETGLHLLVIDTSNDTGDAGFWAAGSDYMVYLNTAKTVDGETVGAILAEFSIENRRTEDVFDRLGAPAGASVSADIMDLPTVSEFNARTLVAASYFDPATDTVALVTTVTTLTGHTAQTADHTAGIADIPTVAEFNARTILSADYFDPAADTVANVTTVAGVTGLTVATIVLGVWDELTATARTVGSYGQLFKDNVNATISSRSSHGDPDPSGFIDAAISTGNTAAAAIQAKTDDLTFTKALELDANIQSINGAGVVGDGNATPWDGA